MKCERGAPGSWSQLLHKTIRILVFVCGAVFGVVPDVVCDVVFVGVVSDVVFVGVVSDVVFAGVVSDDFVAFVGVDSDCCFCGSLDRTQYPCSRREQTRGNTPVQGCA